MTRKKSVTPIQKATSSPTRQRPINTEKGSPGIVSGSRLIQDVREQDLNPSRRFCTFSNMMQDTSVFSPVDFTNIQVVSALCGGEVRGKGSSKSRKAADFLNYCIRNMRYGTWMDAMNTAATDLYNGFAIHNIVVKKAEYGEYKGAYVLDKLSPRRPDSVWGWVWNKNNTELKGFVQKPLVKQSKEPNIKMLDKGIPFSAISGGYLKDSSHYPFISTDQMLHWRHSPTYNNPQGDSALIHCYASWVELMLIKHYEVVGKLN